MTLSTQTSRIEYTANGSQATFNYSFEIFQTSDMKVYKDGVLQTSGYSVTGVGNDNGGTVVFSTAPASGVVVRLARVTAKVQELVLREFQKIPVAAVEKNFDKIVAMIQELAQSDSDINIELDGLQIQLDDLLAFLQSIALQPSAQYVGETQPEFGFQGMRWYNPSAPATYVFYYDGDSGQWVQEAHEGVDGALRSDLTAIKKLKDMAALTRTGLPITLESVYEGWSSTSLGVPYGGGNFTYNPTLAKAKHNGATIIAPEAIVAWDGTAANIATLFNWTGSGTGCFVRASGHVDATTWFADPNGVNESAACFSAYAKSMTNGTMRIPAGSYKVSSEIQNLTAKISIEGAGANCTFINSYLASGRVFAFSGLPTTNAHTHYKGFSVISYTLAATAFNPSDAAYMLFEDITTENFATHWELDSVLTTTFIKCIGRFGPAVAIGVFGTNSGSSNPNALTFIGCSFGSLGGPAVLLANPSRLSYIGGSMESCGTAGGITGQGALVIENGGGQGAAAAYIQTYFEGNGGIADVWVKQYGSTPFTVDVSNSCFNRLPAPRYADNCVRLSQAAGSGFVSLRVGNGCTFQGFNGYAPDAARKYVFIDSANGNYKYVDDGSNFYEADIEAPQIQAPSLTYGATIAVDMKKYSQNDYAHLAILNGAAFTISNPTNGKVGDVLRLFIRNNYGTPAGAVTFGSFYRLKSAFTAPNLNYGSILEFRCSPNGLWVEASRSENFIVV